MQKLSAYNLAQNNNCGLITCSICGRSYRITEFGTDADCQSNSPSASVPNFCPYCASPFERPLTRVRKQEIEDYILDTIRIGMKSDTVLDPETVIDFLCNISDGGFELYDPKFEIYFNSVQRRLRRQRRYAKRVKSLRRTLSPAKLIRLLFLRLVRTIRSSVK